MSLWPTITGAAFGLLAAFIGNLVFLPIVLRLQESRGSKEIWTPFGRKDTVTVTKHVYQFWIPLIFAVIFAIAANQAPTGVAQ
jgi:hypothetical protein